MPSCLGVGLQDLAHLGRERRRRDGLCQKAQALATGPAQSCERGVQLTKEVGPGADLAVERSRLRPVRVVQREHGCLRVGIGGPQAVRVLRIAFHFRRSAHLAFHQHSLSETADHVSARVVKRFAGHDFFGRADVRDDLVARWSARGGAGQRERRSHQLEEMPTADRIGLMVEGVGECLLTRGADVEILACHR